MKPVVWHVRKSGATGRQTLCGTHAFRVSLVLNPGYATCRSCILVAGAQSRRAS